MNKRKGREEKLLNSLEKEGTYENKNLCFPLYIYFSFDLILHDI